MNILFNPHVMINYDECWKEAIQFYLQWFFAFFPAVERDVDWTVDPETLNVELAKILPENQVGRRYADKIFKVYTKGQDREPRLLHVEVQCQPDDDFQRRIHVYNCRSEDCYNQPPLSFALLGDDNPAWRPRRYRFEQWGFVRTMKFPSVKLLSFRRREKKLLQETNPFALLVIAHLQSRMAAADPQERCEWKIRLTQRLRELKLDAEDLRHWLRFLDYLLPLSAELNQVVRQRTQPQEQEASMPIRPSSFEIYYQGEGRKQMLPAYLEGIEALLELKFGRVDPELLELIRQQTDPEVLRRVPQAIKTAASPEEVRRLLS